MHVDWTGVAILVAALSSAFVSVGTFLRQGELHKMVNDQQTVLNKAIQAATAGQASAEGQLKGAADEQARVKEP